MHIGLFGCPWPKKCWAARWSLDTASHLPTRDCSLTAHLWARALSPPQKVMRMLKSVKHLYSAYNLEGKIIFQSSFPSSYKWTDHHSAVPEPGALVQVCSSCSAPGQRGGRGRGGGAGDCPSGGGGVRLRWVRHSHTCLPAPGRLKHKELPPWESSRHIHYHVSHLAQTGRRPRWGCSTARAR